MVGAAHRLTSLLDTLNQLKQSFDDKGTLTAEGLRLYQDRFTGSRAWFSDSSASEKSEFQTGLTFRHPEINDEYLFCPWHGKVSASTLRVHFSWPVSSSEPLYVVYMGPKITKR